MENAKPAGSPVQGLLVETDRPKRSPTIGKIGAALAKAQGEMENAEKDVKGNFGKYATLAATWDAIRKALSSNEIAVYQRPLTVSGKLVMCTMLIHSSGEFIDDGELEMIFDRTGGRITPMQAMGSAVTYARRYTLQAATGVAPADDDDGNGAGAPPKPGPSGPLPKQKQNPPAKQENKPPAKPTTAVNYAPASDEMIDRIYGLAIDRQISEGVLNTLIQAYGAQPGTNPKKWIVDEIGKLLENEDTNEATLMAESQRVISRREAARIKAEADKAAGGQS